MTKASRIIGLVLVILLLSASQNVLNGYEVKLFERLDFAPDQSPILFPRDFCLTEDGLFLISDQHAGEVKIYQGEKKILKLVGTIGGENSGIGKLQYPTYCFYNPEQSKFGVIDFYKRAILLYDRLSRLDFKYDKAIDCPYLADGIQLIGNTLWVSGYTPDERNNPFDLYAIDMSSNRKTLLLPSYLKFSLKSLAEYEEKYMNNLDIRALGISGWFAIQGGHAYYSWEGALNIIKLNSRTGKVVKEFGEQTPYYEKPYASQELLEGYRNRDSEIIFSEKTKMSFIRHLFNDSQHLYVIYEGPVVKEPGSDSSFRMQVYRLNGDLIDDVSIPGQPGNPMRFDNKISHLYSIGKDQGADEYYILKYFVFR